ncbi:acyltransferase [uncultured Sphingomonas sp.]|uniref:acyltransferase family protein n=1 Tax=uncultured Sphingomonas sp. TaxID=158754 RepID=UPI0025F48249|nr:acyltransferase [uncultured Sphingomonas sp.]
MVLNVTDELLRADRNNLTMVRLLLASAVIYTHAMELLGHVDETAAIFGIPVAWVAVNGFFSLSGFLMVRSLERNSSIGQFALSRFFRIWPGMFAMCGIVAVCFAAFTTVPIADYVFGRETLSYVFRTQILSPSYFLTGVYCGEPWGGLCVINGSLWTIRWEVSCYVLIALLSATGMLSRRRFTLFVLPAILLYALIFAYPPAQSWLAAKFGSHLYFLDRAARLWTAFALGAGAYLYRDRIPLSWAGAALAFTVAYVTRGLFFEDFVRAVAVCYWVLCLGFLTAKTFPNLHRIPDYSYGIYIYSMPVTDVFRILTPQIEPHLLAIVALVAVLPFAAFSWHCIEKPAQALRKSLHGLRLPQRQFG